MKNILILSLMLSACGVQNQPAGVDGNADHYIDEKTKSLDHKYKANYDKKNTSPAECSITSLVSFKGVQYVASAVTWGDAIQKAPAGKRLATRGELLLLWDQAYFKGKQFAIDDVWTASTKDDTHAYAVDMVNGQLDFTVKYNLLGAIYVDIQQ